MPLKVMGSVEQRLAVLHDRGSAALAGGCGCCAGSGRRGGRAAGFTTHYNTQRPHQSLDPAALADRYAGLTLGLIRDRARLHVCYGHSLIDTSS